MSANVVEQIFVRARAHPASPAIITQEQVITYGRVRVAVGVVAAHLQQNGVTRGQVVGVSMAQNPLHIFTLLALAQLGAVSLPLHIAIPAGRRSLAAQRFGVSCVVSGRNDLSLDGVAFISLAGLSLDGQTPPPLAEVQSLNTESPFRIAISSGTSGDPKGMVITHRMMALRNQQPEPGLNALSRVIPMDVSFAPGINSVIRAFVLGACVVLPQSMSPEHLLQAIVGHDTTHVTLAPGQAQRVVDQFAVEDVHCPGLVCLRVGGGPVTPELLSRIRRTLTPNVYMVYASTESGILASATPATLEEHPASVGRLNPWAQIEIVDDEDRKLATGKIGLLRIRSEDQVSGYYRDEERNKKHFRDGWFYPGDLGGFDEEGLLYIEGCSDDRLNVGGQKVNPEDIDAVLMAHPAVLEAGAFVSVGAEGGERLAVAAVLRDASQAEEVRQHAQEQLGPLAPQRYFIVPSLPRTITGKLLRAELTAQFSKYKDDERTR